MRIGKCFDPIVSTEEQQRNLLCPRSIMLDMLSRSLSIRSQYFSLPIEYTQMK